jgi:ADP-heptose:LPS heptosyltransferase
VSAPQRILVIKLGALGDVILALGPMAAIRRHHPQAHIIALTTAPYVELLKASPYVDEVWTDTRPRFWQIAAWRRLRRRLREAGFTRVYDLQTSDRSAFYFHLLGEGPEWSGIAPGCSHPHANPGRDGMHTVERQAEQLQAAGITDVPPPDLSWLAADAGRFGLTPPFALFVPGGAATRPRKRWPVERFAALAAALNARGIQPVILGTAPEQPLAEAIRAACPAARSLVGETGFAEIATLARQARLAVGNDTGPMHLIAAAGCPSVVLFSDDSDPALCAPRGKVTVLRRPDLTDLPLDAVVQVLPATLS